MIFENKGVHDGHRARMRAKFEAHGARIFDTYELVEMLLYHVIPMRDTNPMAKGLLGAFGGLSGLLRAEREELVAIPGVGERAAELIGLVGRADKVSVLSADMRPRTTFDDYNRTGRFLVRFFEENEDATAVIMLMDDTMRLLGLARVDTPRFGSGATRAKPFIDAALRYGATLAIIGFTNKNGLVYPFEADVVTCKMLATELSGVGVSLIESYIVGAGRYSYVGPRQALKSAPTPEINSFARSRGADGYYSEYETSATLSELELGVTEPMRDEREAELLEYLSGLLSFAAKDSEKDAELFIERFGSLDNILNKSVESLGECVGEREAHLLKLVAALSSRCVTDDFSFGAKHSDAEVIRYLTALLYGASVETVYLLSFDARGRAIRCDLLGEGTVNASDVYQRRVAECAVRANAASVILAHNHPTGAAVASNEDAAATVSLFATCRASGIRLYRHVIVAGRDHCVLEPDPDDGVIRNVGLGY